MIDAALVELLRAHAGVGIACGGQIVKVTTDLPKVVFTQTDLERYYSDDGNTGLVRARYQLDIFAALPSTARNIADAIRIGLDDYTGVVADTHLLRVYFDGERHQAPQRVDGQAVSVARYSQDLIVVYRDQT